MRLNVLSASQLMSGRHTFFGCGKMVMKLKMDGKKIMFGVICGIHVYEIYVFIMFVFLFCICSHSRCFIVSKGLKSNISDDFL